MKKKKKISGLSLNKKTISSLQSNRIMGGKYLSGVDCVTQQGSCQTTSCVCTNNHHCVTKTKIDN